MANSKVMGIVFSNTHETGLGELTNLRSVGSIPFGGRYRLIDFVLSNMVNCGIRDVGVVTTHNYQSLMAHLGSGRSWDLARNHGGLVLLPPYSRMGGPGFERRGSLEDLAVRMQYLQSVDADYVVLSDCDVIANIDLKDMLRFHKENGADMTVAYGDCKVTEAAGRDLCTLELTPYGRVTDVTINPIASNGNVYLNMVIVSRELLMKLVADGYTHGKYSFSKHILQEHLHDYRFFGYKAPGFVARITGMESYFATNMALLDPEARAQLFPAERPVYTQVRDQVPVKYGLRSDVQNCLIADGCIIEGKLENCVVFRGVRVGRGAVVRNSILMKNVIVGENADLNYVVADKNVVVRSGRTLCGYTTIPIYLQKGMSV